MKFVCTKCKREMDVDPTHDCTSKCEIKGEKIACVSMCGFSQDIPKHCGMPMLLKTKK